MIALVKAVEPKNQARTPLGASLREVRNDLAAATGPRTVVLLTDGEETCDGDPQAEIEALRKEGYEVRVNIVGFAVGDAQLKAMFRDWAAAGGGRYFDAQSGTELGEAMREAVSIPFRVLDATGRLVAQGFVGGGSVPLPAGVYSVAIGEADPKTFPGVLVEEGRNTELRN